MWLVDLVLLGPQDLLEAFNDESRLFTIKSRSINCFLFSWGLLLLVWARLRRYLGLSHLCAWSPSPSSHGLGTSQVPLSVSSSCT
jgi:hypothetical protein